MVTKVLFIVHRTKLFLGFPALPMLLQGFFYCFEAVYFADIVPIFRTVKEWTYRIAVGKQEVLLQYGEPAFQSEEIEDFGLQKVYSAECVGVLGLPVTGKICFSAA